MPVLLLTVATNVLLLLQVPPVLPLLVKPIVDPMQTVDAPLILPAFTEGFTVMVIEDDVALQPATEYMIVVVPAATPVTIPVLLLTVATALLLLLQVPPVFPLLVKV